ncbi:MAG: hypothetical protein JW929_02575 [Anaerolineales bacterium]|nr:hypothetical protein [Anaerolineales bacterium]
MTITTCPHCQMRIIPRPDGTCPSCNGLVARKDPPPVARTGAAVIKRTAKMAPKTTARRQSASKAGKAARPAPPAPPSAKSIEPLYQDYLQSAREVRAGARRAFYPYLALGIIIPIASLAASFLTWQEQLVVFEKKPQPVPLTWVMIWGGIVIGLGVIVLGAIQGDRRGYAQAREVAKDRLGFSEFYAAFIKRLWPKEGMPSGAAFEKLLILLGKK